MLLEDGSRLMLVDCGIGNKQDEKFFSHYYLHGEDSLDRSLGRLGFHRDEITDVFLTHLHFDHCGGAIGREGADGRLVPTFRNAYFWSSERHWKWATEPNVRERASFLVENILPISESGQLRFVPRDGIESKSVFEGIDVCFMDGHTDSQMLPKVRIGDKTVVFMADLLPSVGHIPLPYVMGYDTRPLLTLEEKSRFLEEAADGGYILFLEHDSDHECCVVGRTDRGIRVLSTGTLEEYLG